VLKKFIFISIVLGIESRGQMRYNFYHSGLGDEHQKEIIMVNEKFAIKSALTYGWESFKAHRSFFVGLMLDA